MEEVSRFQTAFALTIYKCTVMTCQCESNHDEYKYLVLQLSNSFQLKPFDRKFIFEMNPQSRMAVENATLEFSYNMEENGHSI